MNKDDMKNDKINEGGATGDPDIKQRVMADIKTKKIKMRRRIIFVLEKLGLEGALLLMLLVGTLLVSLLFYFVTQAKLEKFLTLGTLGMQVFFETLPYDYLILFVVALALAIYFANRLELFCGNCSRTDTFMGWFLLGVLGTGLLLGALGVGSLLGGWSKNRIPSERAIHGQIQFFSDDSQVTVIDDDGMMVQIFSATPPSPDSYAPDKFLRAVGQRDQNDATIFHAEKVRCCDDD